MPHVLTAAEMPVPELFHRAEIWRRRLTEQPIPPLQPKAALIALLFYEPSTRTRAAFEQAAVLLGYHPLVLTAEASSVAKGESLQDTVRTLNAQGIRAIVIRHPQAGAPWLAAQVSEVPILNAGDGAHEHPTQALLDLYTLWLHYGKPDPTTRWLSGRKIAIVGDIRHSRVARSNLILMARAGAEVWLCAPPTLQPDAPLPHAHHTHDADEAIRDADVVMALRLQTERMQQGLMPSLDAYRRDYQVHAERLRLAKPNCVVMHPGPIQRGVEISDEVADSPRSLILTQVRNGVYVRAAVLEWAIEAPKMPAAE
ncbi:MAG: aspartate carbamoyltransferase catalytic subunit [Armatimonadota bacterium]|nr:aspartate carbamoyltransferase catalytic subunit [Armatimonadota bacterium]